MKLRIVFLLLLTSLMLQAMNNGEAKRRKKAVPTQDSGLALLEAARNGDENKVKALLEAGADPNVVDNYRRTPLMLAAKIGIARELLNHHADHTKLDQYGETALIWAVWRHQNFDLAKLLLARGADPNLTSWERQTALMYGAISGTPAMIQLLIEAGADMHIKGPLDRTALMVAIDNGNAAVAQVLLVNGADTSGIDFGEFFREAISRHELEMLRLSFGHLSRIRDSLISFPPSPTLRST